MILPPSFLPFVRRPVCTASLPRVFAITTGPEFTVAEAEAQSLIGKGRFDEALAVLRWLTLGWTESDGVLFGIGLAAIGAARTPGLSIGLQSQTMNRKNDSRVT